MSQEQLNKEVYKKSSLIFISKLFVSLSRIVTTILFSHQLTQALYGQYQNFWVQSSTLFALSGLSLAGFVLNYSPEQLVAMKQKLESRNIATGLALALFAAMIFGYIQFQSGFSFGWALLFLLINSFSVIIDSFLIVFKKIKALLWINGLYFLLFVAAHFYVLKFTAYSFELLIAFCTLISFLKLLTCFLIIKPAFKNSNAAENTLQDSRYRQLWRHLYLFDIFQIGMSFSDKFIISLLLSPEDSAAYQNATYTVPLLAIIFSAVSGAVQMQLRQSADNNEQQITVLNNAGKLFGTIAFAVFFLFMAFSKEFMAFVFSSKYENAVPIFQMSLLIIPLYAFNWTIFLQNREQGATINKGLAVDLVALLILIFPLYKTLGLKGIPLAYALATLMQSAYYVWHHSKLLRATVTTFLPITDWLKKIILFAVLSFGLHYMLVEIVDLPANISLIIAGIVIGFTCLGILLRALKVKI